MNYYALDRYKEDVMDDLRTWAEEGNLEGVEALDDLKDRLLDASYTDSITGNASGSYFCNAWKAAEVIDERHLLWDESFIDALEAYGVNLGDIIKKGAEAVDVWARCIALEYLTDEELIEATGGEYCRC